MAEFPTGFTEPHVLRPTDVQSKYAMDIIKLQGKGLDVVAGIQSEDVACLTEIATQEGTREYCPNDLARRWTDIPTAQKQLAKDGGRGVLRLVSREDGLTMGFGWTGPSSSEEQQYLPMCENTFALRMHERARGQRLAAPFSKVIVIGSMALFKARNIGLETWGSNTAAVRSYLGANAVLVTTKYDTRPTLNEELRDANGACQDVRLYMRFPWSA